MMNAELVSENENRIIVPTVFRNNYLVALKALSQNRVTGSFASSISRSSTRPWWIFQTWIELICSWTVLMRSPIRMRPMPLASILVLP